MDIRTRVTAVLTAGILAAAPIVAFALSNYTLNGNYDITGTLQVNTLNPSQCVATNASRVLISSGAACGGGGGGAVTSVTSIDSNGNLTATPTTGAVVLNYSNSPTYTGLLTAGNMVDTFIAGGQCVATDLFTDRLIGNNGCVQHITAGTGITLGGTAANPIINASGGGGAVSSVTAGPNGNITVAPTTGAVVVDEITNPTFVNVTDSSLTPGDCVQAGAGGILTSTGSACGGGGGGVTSVTNTDGNLAIAPTTGAVVANLATSISVPGTATIGVNDDTSLNVTNITMLGMAGTASDGVSGNGQMRYGNASGVGPQISLTGTSSNPANAVSSIQGDIFFVDDLSGSNSQLALNHNGNLGVFGSYFSGTLASSVGDCLEASTNGQIISTGSACGSPGGGFPAVQQLHGNQSITAVAAACTPGTPIVFSNTFSAVPDIIMSTSAVVGDTGAPVPGSITTTGFTPEICSVASAATATVYWNAVN